MYVDASALVAMIIGEAEAPRLLRLLDAAITERITSPVALFETAAAIARLRLCTLADAEDLARDFCREAGIREVAIDSRHGEMALRAFARFGKGRHKAALNMGDCFGYAVARSAAAPMLFIGDDFSQTDLILAG